LIQFFERHPNPAVADIGKGGGVEFTVGRCRHCGAVLMHCWAGGVAEGVVEISQELVDQLLAAAPESRKAMLIAWYDRQA